MGHLSCFTACLTFYICNSISLRLCWVFAVHGLSSSYSECGLHSSCGSRLLTVGPSLVEEHGLYGLWASETAVHGLNSCGSQGLEPPSIDVAPGV